MRNWLKAGAAMALLGYSWLVGAADTWQWPGVKARIEQFFPRVQGQWEVKSASPEFPDDGELGTMPNGGAALPPVSYFPRTVIMARLAKLSSGQREIYVRWLVAHELWHRHQYEKTGEQPDPSVSSQRRECEADVMGAAFASEEELSQVSLDMSQSSQKSVRNHLLEVRDAVDPKLTDPDAGAGYPLLEQRRQATRIGVSLGLLKRLESAASANEPAAEGMIANVASAIMMGEDPTFDVWLDHVWLDHVCGRIVHDGDGVPGLVFEPVTILWHTTGDDPTVEVSQIVTNTANFPVEVYSQISSIYIERKHRQETAGWNLVDRKAFKVRLEPGESTTFYAELGWAPADWSGIEIHPGSKMMPAVVAPGLRPGDPMVFYNAVRVQ